MTNKIPILIHFVLGSFGCNGQMANDSTCCHALNMVILNYNQGFKTNKELNRFVPILEVKTSYKATCESGSYGYYYSQNDSLLLSDIIEWKVRLKEVCSDVELYEIDKK